jgi:hypothetical protein
MTSPIVYWGTVTETCSVLIAAADLLPALQPRATITGADVLTFTENDALRALAAVSARRPKLVALERQFAATPRGAALINRIKADPSLAQTEIRVLAHDSDYSRVVPRGTTNPAAASAAAAHAAAAAAKPAAPAGASSPAGVADAGPPPAAVDPQTLDHGTRRAPRVRMVDKVEIIIDGNPASLVELSAVGAQVVSPTILKPNQRVRIVLTDEGNTIRVSAAVAWAAYEIPPGVRPQYRAGIEFLDADAAAIEVFCRRHGS